MRVTVIKDRTKPSIVIHILTNQGARRLMVYINRGAKVPLGWMLVVARQLQHPSYSVLALTSSNIRQLRLVSGYLIHLGLDEGIHACDSKLEL